MKRDLDLLSRVLLAVEAAPSLQGGWTPLEFEEVDSVTLAHHVLLLRDAGLLEAVDLSDHDGIDWQPSRLTNAGHHYLDELREKGTRKFLRSLGDEAKKASLPELTRVVLKALLARVMSGG